MKIGNARSAGSSVLPALSANTVTATCSESASAQNSAEASGPTISMCPPDVYATRGTGSGSGIPAIASRAAIFGVAALASADQPAVSRMLTKRIVCAFAVSSATSPRSLASCVHATTTSPRASAAKVPSSFWHSIDLTPPCGATPMLCFSASASSGIVPLHEQSQSCLSAMLMWKWRRNRPALGADQPRPRRSAPAAVRRPARLRRRRLRSRASAAD